MGTKQRETRVLTDSLLKAVRRCPRLYWLRYTRELVPVRTAVPLVWGTLGHLLVGKLYELARDNTPAEAKVMAPKAVVATADQWLERMVQEAREVMASKAFGLDGNLEAETHEAASKMREEALSVVTHYMGSTWLEDLDRWEVLLVEVPFQVPLPDALDRRHPWWVFRGKIDLVARERDTGLVVMADHKFTSREAEGYAAELDTDTQPQGYLYAGTVLATTPAHLRRPGDAPDWPPVTPAPSRFVHNIIRRTAPAEPPLLKGRKKPTLSQARTLVTTEALYRKALDRHGLDPEPYQETLDRLRKAPHAFVYRRSPNIGPEELVRWAREALVTARTVAKVERDGDQAAVRHEGTCRQIAKRCPYIPLCWGQEEAALVHFRHEVRHVELEPEEDPPEAEGGHGW